MKAALDTNVLAAAEGVDGAARRKVALDLLRALPRDRVVLPAQVLGELFNVLVRKAGRSRSDARSAMLGWRDAFPVAGTTTEAIVAAADLATDHRMAIWDLVILSVSSNAGCRVLLSEDLHPGFTWGGITVLNPFDPERHHLLDALLDPGP